MSGFYYGLKLSGTLDDRCFNYNTMTKKIINWLLKGKLMLLFQLVKSEVIDRMLI